MAANVAVRQVTSFESGRALPAPGPASAAPVMPGQDESFDFLTHPDELKDTTSTAVPDSRRLTQSGDRYASSALQVPDSPPELEFPFMRAEHSFDASTLANKDVEQDPSSICLSFSEGDIVFGHGFHETGWGDVTLLHTGKRGWIPINYFSPFADVKAIPLLSAAASFIDSPKSYKLVGELDEPKFTFSQAAINEIVSGVRSLLELTGTLNRDSPVAQRSLTIRRYRKALLTELAYVVSLARDNKRTLDDAVIEKLVRGVYRVVMKAAALLDVWTVDEKLHSTMLSSDDEGHSPPDSPAEAPPHTPHLDPTSFPPTPTTPSTPATITQASAKRINSGTQLAVHHGIPPAGERIEEVVDTLCEYLEPFIERMSSVERDKNASVQILAITRHSMLACRELLIVVEAVAVAAEPTATELKRVKEQLFVRIRLLVSSARHLVAALGDTPTRISAAGQKLSQVAEECAQLARDAVVWCNMALKQLGPNFVLPDRDYPLFKERPLSEVSNQLLSGFIPSSSANNMTSEENKRISTMSHASSIATTVSSTPSQFTETDVKPPGEDPLRDIHPDLIVRGQRVRGGTLSAIVAFLESPRADSFSRHAFLLTFRLYTNAVDLAEACVGANAVRVATRWLESFFDDEDLPSFEILKALPDLEDVISQRRAWPAAKQLVSRALADVDDDEISVGGLNASAAASSVTLASVVSSSRRQSVSRGKYGSQDDVRHLTGLHSIGSAFRLGGGSANGSTTAGARLLEYDASLLAAQLALMDAEVFEQLRPSELLDQRFSVSKRALGQAPNVVRLVQMSNHLSAFVADTILGAENLSAKTRKNIIRHWIKVAQACYDCGNLNGLVTIVSTLQSANIIRLRKIWGLLSTKNMSVLEKLGQLAAPDRNFQAYRQETRSRFDRPTIPYFGLYLSDLTFIDEGNPKRLNIRPGVEGVNLDRYLKASRAISELQQFQLRLPLDVTPNVPVQIWLRQEMTRSYSSFNSDSDNHWRRSLYIEPR